MKLIKADRIIDAEILENGNVRVTERKLTVEHNPKAGAWAEQTIEVTPIELLGMAKWLLESEQEKRR